ncbi:MAG TPA: GNAT family N-acetyltransferase [Opitutaceae bacterium]
MKPKPSKDEAAGAEDLDSAHKGPEAKPHALSLFGLGPLVFPLFFGKAPPLRGISGNSLGCDLSDRPHFAPPPMRLVEPCEAFGASYVSLVGEFRALGERGVPFVLDFPTDDFPAFLRRLRECAAGSEIAKGFVAHETFWLVDPEDRVVGVSNLRLTLTDGLRKEGGHIGYGIRPSARRRGYATLILALTLAKARERGIQSALVTCDKANLGSAKTILRNGGRLESEEPVAGGADIKQRYWIPLV